MLAGTDRFRRRLETGLRRLAHGDGVDRDVCTQQRIHTLEHRYRVDRAGKARRRDQFEIVRRRDGRTLLVMRDLAERSDTRRVGKEGVRTWRTRWSACHN